jgi:hypothetical protein
MATAQRIYAARDVACDLSGGYIGMRGGFGPRGAVEFRRFRLELDEGEMYAFFKSTGQESFEAIDIDAEEVQFAQRGTIVTSVVPMVLDHGATTAINATLGTDLPRDSSSWARQPSAAERYPPRRPGPTRKATTAHPLGGPSCCYHRRPRGSSSVG